MTDKSPDLRLPRHTLHRRGMGLVVLTTGAAALLMGFRAPTIATTPGSGSVASAASASASPLAGASVTPSPTPCVDAASAASAGTSGAPAPSAIPAPSASASADPCASPTASLSPSPSPVAVTQQVLTGQGVETGFGVVQVSITVEGTTITDVQAVALPYDRPRSREISTAVEPMLRQEALQAQSAQIDLISGATYTSEGYAMSLQSAIDQIGQ